jgi:hypothetical protein
MGGSNLLRGFSWISCGRQPGLEQSKIIRL